MDKKMKQVRVIYILGGSMKYGGTEAFIMNYYRHINHDIVQIDFIYQGEEAGVYDKELVASGSKIFHVPYKSRKPIEFTKRVADILKKNNYKIIHSQMDAMGLWPLAIAKHVRVPVRIAHSHNTSHQTEIKIKILWNNLAKLLLRKYATDYFACGEKAGIFLFGEKKVKSGEVVYIHNAIETNKYKYNEYDRKKLREMLGIKDNEFVVGHVGQFRKQKNHKFLLEIYKEILKKRKNSRLVLIGDGELKPSMEQYADKLAIIDRVLFLGARNDIEKMLNVFDVFIFPSLFEGLSVVMIEAQANGLPCIMSDTIAEETKLTELISSMSLGEAPTVWADKALKIGRREYKDYGSVIKEKGYDIEIEASKLQERYLQILQEGEV